MGVYTEAFAVAFSMSGVLRVLLWIPWSQRLSPAPCFSVNRFALVKKKNKKPGRHFELLQTSPKKNTT